MIFKHLIYAIVQMDFFIHNVHLDQVIQFDIWYRFIETKASHHCQKITFWIAQKAIRYFIVFIFFCTAVATSTARTLSCPCQNGGVCTMPGSQTCSCSNGFTGRFCERSLRKISISFWLSSIFFCGNQIMWYSSWFCFLIILGTGDCNQIQCSNGGTCFANSPDSSGLAYCACKGGYTGKFCETG